VGLIYYEQGVMTPCEFSQTRERGDVTVHAEHGLADDDPLAGGSALLEQGFQVIKIVVAVAGTVGAAEPDAVNNAGVVQLVREYLVARLADGRQHPKVGQEPTAKYQGRFRSHHARQIGFQFLGDLQVAGKQPGRRRTRTVLADGGRGGLFEPRIRRQTEVVVRGEIQDCLAVFGDVPVC
jgi:hypothetical protein